MTTGRRPETDIGERDHRRLMIQRQGDTVTIEVGRPPLIPYCLVRLILYAGVAVFAIVAVVQSHFTVVSVAATTPFLLGAVLLFWRTAVLASTTAAIEIGPGRVSVRTSGGGHSLSLTGNPQTTHVQGPQTSGPLGNRPGLLDMPFLRIVTEAGEMDVGHGHSEADVRTIRRAIEPLISGARPKD